MGSNRISQFCNFYVSDRVKIRANELNFQDHFEYANTLYIVTEISDTRITYRQVGEYTIFYGFGKKSQLFIYKVLLN
jgi:hypothetical protein